jgi:hypothetical protein
MKAQATIEGIERVMTTRELGIPPDTRMASAITPPSGEVIVAEPAIATEPVRIEAVRWSVIIAGGFVAIASMWLLGMLAALLALPPFLPNPLRFEPAAPGVGPLVVAIVSLLAFTLGGWVASRLSIVHTWRTGLLAGALVWALCVPVIASGMVAAQALAGGFPVAMATRGPSLRIDGRIDGDLELRGERILTGERLRAHAGVGLLAIVVGLGASLLGGSLGVGHALRRLRDAPRRQP